jgi:hypothetical protein
MGKFIDLTGQRFGRLVVIERAENNKFKHSQWLCQCDCGNEKIITKNSLKSGSTKSCGCLQKENNIPENKLYLIGKTFGKLKVIEQIEKPNEIMHKGRYFLCECSCSEKNKIILRSDALNVTQSCGCLRNEKTSERSKINYGEASFNHLYAHYKRHARTRNLIWNLNQEDFRKLINQNCFYCGCEPQQKWGKSINNGYYIYNGIDRKDNNIGYNIENCVSCCGECNRAKLNFSIDIFWNKINKIHENFIK